MSIDNASCSGGRADQTGACTCDWRPTLYALLAPLLYGDSAAQLRVLAVNINESRSACTDCCHASSSDLRRSLMSRRRIRTRSPITASRVSPSPFPSLSSPAPSLRSHYPSSPASPARAHRSCKQAMPPVGGFLGN